MQVKSIRRFPSKILKRLVIMQSLLLLLAVGLSGLAARHYFKTAFLGQVENQLHDSLTALSREWDEPMRASWCADHALGTAVRYTVISTEGVVLCDSHHAIATMDNHGQRPEVLAALSEGFGHSLRHSKTLQEDMLYGAVKVPAQPVILRGAIELSRLHTTLHIFDASLALVLGVVLAALSLFSLWSGRHLVAPMGRVLERVEAILGHRAAVFENDDDAELSLSSYGEWTELEASLEKIRHEIESKSERLEVEREEQATLMAAISDAVLAVDPGGRILFYNSRFAALFGAEEIQRRRSLAELFREPELLEAFQNSLQRGTTGSLQAMPFESGGRRIYLSVSTSPLGRRHDRVYGAIGIFHDVTELKRAEQIRIDFVANVSHELRTPLTSIKGYTDTLMQDVGAGKAAEKPFLETIQRNTERLMSLIHDLLDLSSLESEGGDFQRSSIDSEEITARIIKQMRGSFDARKQIVELSSGEKRVYADARRLEQVLVNLLDNANKYTPSGGQIQVAWSRGEGGASVLTVKDSGPGIAAEDQPRLFERFYRVDKARSRELGGTGLGLAIVKHILQRHGGTVAVESALGRGATFVCRFPPQPAQA